jgi:microsomal dipeptidase-like Zn-dependent dipeptidase
MKFQGLRLVLGTASMALAAACGADPSQPGAVRLAAATASPQQPWRWGPVKKDHCSGEGRRQVSSRLWNIPSGTAWEDACRNASRNVMGIEFARPDRCVDLGAQGEWGEWDVPDTACLSGPPPAPTRGDTGNLASSSTLEGYADIHVHQMGHLGFGGSIVWGGAYGPPASVLGPIPAAMKPGHDRTEAVFQGDYVGGLLSTATHEEEGSPSFSSWPTRELATHQQVYEDWLFRAYVGGLRLMVMLAVNSEDMFGRGENDIPVIGNSTFQDVKAEGRSGNDMEALEWQVREAYRMQADIDLRNGGPGRGWYRIVRDPDEASAVVAQGKLAVILGSELQHLFNCDADRPACSPATISEGLDRLEAMGVNYVFPIHHKENQFGGSAQFNALTSGATEDCIETNEPCASTGLTTLGRFLVEELSARGMLIDTEHMGWKAFSDALDIAEARSYPVLAGHVGAFDLQAGDNQREQQRRADQFRRILNVGGMLGIILGAGAEEYAPHAAAPVRVPISCGGADQWANTYLFLKDLAAGGLTEARGKIAIGSDWNGFSAWASPRYGTSPCEPRRTRSGQPIPKASPVEYPIALPATLLPAALGGTTSLPRFEWFRSWDYNAEGLMHVGLMPDFFEDLRRTGLSLAELEPLYRSARGVVELWKQARDRQVNGDRHRLRWVAQSPFDVLAFEYADVSRNVEALPGYPICRSRNGARLGFERDGTCTLIESAAPVAGPVEIVASHSGMCVAAESNVVQRSCGGGQFGSQFDLVSAGSGHSQLRVVRDNKCLDVSGGSSADGASIVESPCDGRTSQRWQPRTTSGGLTEYSNEKSGKCLRVALDSSAAGAQLVQASCAGLSSQRFIQRAPTKLQTYELLPVALSAYHAGRCLDVEAAATTDGAKVKQWACNGAPNQRWQLRSNDKLNWEVVAVHSGKCLEVEALSSADLANVQQSACRGGSQQQWQLVRTGNTFRLLAAHSGKCLDVRGEGRANGTSVVQYACHGASNQQWSIESLRGEDHERLYQADKQRIAWLSASSASYPVAVTVDGTRAVCRSRDPSHGLGVVSGSTCVGKSYEGAAMIAEDYERLFQMP